MKCAALKQAKAQPLAINPNSDQYLEERLRLLDEQLATVAKLAESSPGMTYAKLSWLQAWHIREETYSVALAELVNSQFNHTFAGNWGDGTTSSSDGQRFRAGGRGLSTGAAVLYPTSPTSTRRSAHAW